METEQPTFKIFKGSQIWNESRPVHHKDYDGHDLGHLPLYQHDTIARGQFRLLHLKPGSGKEQLQFELRTARLDESPPYEAISYCWGEVVPSCNIICTGTRLPVTKNGADALWHFRLPDKARVLWMDIICINQENKVEKSEQVSDMHKIYSGAEKTLAFGASAAVHDHNLFESLRKLLKTIQQDIISQVQAIGLHERNPHVRDVVNGIETADNWLTWSYLYYCMQNIWEDEHGLKEVWVPVPRLNNEVARQHIQKIDFGTGLALRKLCDREYFHRCWVLQELVLSQRSILYVGTNEMPWDEFAAVVWIIGQTSGSIPGLQVAANPISQNYSRRVFRALAQEEGVNQLSVLQSALLSCGLRAHKPVDRIYAMRNLMASSGSEEEIPVDYRQDFTRTYLDVGQSIMSAGTVAQKTNRLAFVLTFLKLTERHENGSLPSWIPDFEALTAADLHLMAVYAKFHASKDIKHLESAHFYREDPKLLVLNGRITDGILSFSDLEPSPIFGTHGIIGDSFEVAEWQSNGRFNLAYVVPSWIDYFRMMSTEAKPSSQPKELQEYKFSLLRELLARAVRRLRAARDFVGRHTDGQTFWRAFLCDFDPRIKARVAVDKPFPSIDASTFLDATPSLVVPSNWTSDHPITEKVTLATLIDAYHFLSQIEHWRDARFGRTGSGRLAWMPVKAQLDDKICLFGGSRTFHVVRADRKRAGCWNVVGPAYIHGLMDGESSLTTPIEEDDFLFIS